MHYRLVVNNFWALFVVRPLTRAPKNVIDAGLLYIPFVITGVEIYEDGFKQGEQMMPLL